MKNIMRRAAAFVLMACLLLSVMAPTAMAAPIYNEETGVYTYDIIDPQGRSNSSSGYVASIKSADFDLTDFKVVAWGSTNGNTRLVKDDNYGYRININRFDLNGRTNQWIALKFSVAEAGKNQLNIQKNIFFADVVVEKYDETETYDDAYVAALAGQGTTSDTITLPLEKADYVLFLKANSTSTRSNSQLYGMTLTKVPVATVETKYDFAALASEVAALGDHAELSAYNCDPYYEAGTTNFTAYACSTSGYLNNGKYQSGLQDCNPAVMPLTGSQ